MKTRRRVKKFFLIGAVLMVMTLFTFCSQQRQVAEMVLSKENILEHLEVFTSDEYEGRMAGTEGNFKTVRYIEDYFKMLELEPVEDNQYSIPFHTPVPVQKEPAFFRVFDNNGKLIQEYKEGEDFKVRMDDSSMGGTFRGNLYHVTQYIEIIKTDDRFHQLAVIVDYGNPEFNTSELNEKRIDERLYTEKAKAIIYKELDSIDVRNIDLGDKMIWVHRDGVIKIGVTEKIFDELIHYGKLGYEVEIIAPLSFPVVTCSNVFGVLPGKSRLYDQYIMVATSLDGLGVGQDGRIYVSTLDNAVALATMLELARVIQENNLKFDATLIFAAYNGKHTGNNGLIEYQYHPLFPQERTKVVYLDKIGSGDKSRFKIATLQNPNAKRKKAKELVSQLTAIGKNLGISYEEDFEYYDSEYILFRINGIPSAVLTHGKNDKIGTVHDTLDYVNIEKAVEVGDLILAYLNQYGNNDVFADVILAVKRIGWMPIGIAVLAFIKFYIIPKKKIKMNKILNLLTQYPILSILLLLFVLTVILIIQTQYHLALFEGISIDEVNIAIADLRGQLWGNLFAIPSSLLMIIVYILPALIIVVLIEFLCPDLPVKAYMVLSGIITAGGFMIPLSILFDHRYTVVFPTIIGYGYAEYILPVALSILSFGIVYVWKLEKKEIKRFSLYSIFLSILMIIVLFLLAPYLFSKEIIELRSMGRRIYF